MKYLIIIIIICIVGLFSSIVSRASRVPDRKILSFLKVELRDYRFKSLECSGNNPPFKLSDKLETLKKGVGQRKVTPKNATITFKAILNIGNKDMPIIGYIDIKASHGTYWLANIDYIKYFISMNEWYFVNPADDIDIFCD